MKRLFSLCVLCIFLLVVSGCKNPCATDLPTKKADVTIDIGFVNVQYDDFFGLEDDWNMYFQVELYEHNGVQVIITKCNVEFYIYGLLMLTSKLITSCGYEVLLANGELFLHCSIGGDEPEVHNIVRVVIVEGEDANGNQIYVTGNF